MELEKEKTQFLKTQMDMLRNIHKKLETVSEESGVNAVSRIMAMMLITLDTVLVECVNGELDTMFRTVSNIGGTGTWKLYEMLKSIRNSANENAHTLEKIPTYEIS